MAKFRCYIPAFACIALFAVPALAQAGESAHALEAQIKVENDRWAQAYARNDYKAIGELYTDDGMLLPPGENPVVGPAAIAAYFAKKSDKSSPHTVSFDNVEFYGDSHMVTEISGTQIRAHDGKILSRGKQTLVFLKQGDRWKLHRDMWKADASLIQISTKSACIAERK